MNFNALVCIKNYECEIIHRLPVSLLICNNKFQKVAVVSRSRKTLNFTFGYYFHVFKWIFDQNVQ